MLTTHSPEETLQFGERLGRLFVGGEVLGLVGSLGAGKTQLVKGIALGNGLDDPRKVTSPTFTLVQEYPGRLTLFHVDAYRLQDMREMASLGLDEMVRPDSVLVIEWADRVRDVLPDDVFWIHLEPSGASSRELRCEAKGVVSNRLLQTFQPYH
ncbi:MAG: tRNA (adenosine(37)-N6)-threonylcarbamoyltransferase complex ATPase subunit type 1 TsaE [Planctomycetota bacterium]